MQRIVDEVLVVESFAFSGSVASAFAWVAVSAIRPQFANNRNPGMEGVPPKESRTVAFVCSGKPPLGVLVVFAIRRRARVIRPHHRLLIGVVVRMFRVQFGIRLWGTFVATEDVYEMSFEFVDVKCQDNEWDGNRSRNANCS